MMPGAQVGLELGSFGTQRQPRSGFVPPTPPFNSGTPPYAWFDSSDPSYSTNDGATFSQVTDKVQGLSYSQPSPSLRPRLNSYKGYQTALFGPDVRYFRADWLSSMLSNRTPWSMTFSFNLGTTGAYQFLLGSIGPNGGTFVGCYPPGFYIERNGDGLTNSAGISSLSTGFFTFTAWYKQADDSVWLRFNGQNIFATAHAGGNELVDTVYIGADPRGDVRQWYANTPEIIFYSGTIPDYEGQNGLMFSHEQYIHNKYGDGSV